MNDMVDALKRAIAGAPKGDKVVTIHMFGIQHADRLDGLNLQELAERAGIGKSFGTELRKGVRLAEYVQLRTNG